jgi:hypothetical protein
MLSAQLLAETEMPPEEVQQGLATAELIPTQQGGSEPPTEVPAHLATAELVYMSSSSALRGTVPSCRSELQVLHHRDQQPHIMHFLEPAQFLNALDLAGRKVNVLYIPLTTLRPTNNHFGKLGVAIPRYFGHWGVATPRYPKGRGVIIFLP